MDKKKLLNRTAMLILFIFILHFLATNFYWYYSLYWFDMMMHFLGGGFILLLVAYIFPPKKAFTHHLPFLLAGVLAIGVAWEVFEFIFKNVMAGDVFDRADSTSDIFFDLLGGGIALLYFSKRIMPLHGNKV